MSDQINRRRFLEQTAIGGVALSAMAAARANGNVSDRKVTVGIMGTGGRVGAPLPPRP